LVVDALTQHAGAVSSFLCERKALRLPEAGGLRGQPELVWILA
jgi:hypothetical protein